MIMKFHQTGPQPKRAPKLPESAKLRFSDVSSRKRGSARQAFNGARLPRESNMFRQLCTPPSPARDYQCRG